MEAKTTEQEVADISQYFSNISHVFLTEYEQNGLKKHTKYIFDFFKDTGVENKTILELGCGVGGLLFQFLDLGANEAYGVDLSEEMVKSAEILSRKLNYSDRSHFYVGDFNDLSKGLLPINKVDIVVADRVLCCSPVPLKILSAMLLFKPSYLVIVQPRKNYLYRLGMSIKIKIRQIRLRVRDHKAKIPFISVKEYDKVCEEAGYTRILQKFRYAWELVIYSKD